MHWLARHPLLISVIFGVLVAVGICTLERVSAALGVVLIALGVLMPVWRFAIAARAGCAARR